MQLSKNHNKKQGLFFISIITLVLLCFIPESLNNDHLWSKKFSVYLIIVLFFQLIVLRRYLAKDSYLFCVFLLLSYLFNFSQVLLDSIGYTLPDTLLTLSVSNNNNVPEASVVALRSILGLFEGGVLFFSFHSFKSEASNIKFYNPDNKFIKILFVIGFVFDFIYNIYISLTFGYGGTEGSIVITLFRQLSLLFPAGFALYITRESIPMKNKTFVFLFFVIYKIFCMLTGYRAYALINIVLSIILYNQICNKIKLSFKSILVFAAVGLLGSSFLTAIRDTRQNGVDIDTIANYLFETNFGSIFNIAAEFGITLNVICVVLRETNGLGVCGGQLITSLLSIIPGIRAIFPGIDYDNLTLDTALDIHELGGSYISDLLFDFGVSNIFVSSIFLGLFLCKVFRVFEVSIKNRNSTYVAFLFPIIVDLIFCVRSSLAKMPREIVWYFIIFYILWIIFSGRGFNLRMK